MEEDEPSFMEIEVDPLTTNPGLGSIDYEVGGDDEIDLTDDFATVEESQSGQRSSNLDKTEKGKGLAKQTPPTHNKKSKSKGASKNPLKTGAKKVQCAACQLQFLNKISYKLHVCPPHITDSVFFCKLCNIVFKDLAEHTDHTNSVHQPASKVEQCHICKSNGRSSLHVDLAKHIEKFHKICRICPKVLELNSFVRKMSERELENIPPYFCIECSKTFSWDETPDWDTLQLERKLVPAAQNPPLTLDFLRPHIPTQKTAEPAAPSGHHLGRNRVTIAEHLNPFKSQQPVQKSAPAVTMPPSFIVQESKNGPIILKSIQNPHSKPIILKPIPKSDSTMSQPKPDHRSPEDSPEIQCLDPVIKVKSRKQRFKAGNQGSPASDIDQIVQIDETGMDNEAGQMSKPPKGSFIYQPIPDKSTLPVISESFQIRSDLPDILWEHTDVEDFVEGEKFVVKPKVKRAKKPEVERDANGKKIKVKQYKMCEHCGLKLTVHSLAKHIETRHKEPEPDFYRPFDCDLCERKFTSTSALRRHKIINHTKGQDLVRLNCDLCEASFASNDARELHKNSVHTNMKPYSCDTCGRTFFAKSQLIRHKVRIHNETKEFKCRWCKEVFPSLKKMRVHSSTAHESFWINECNVCKKKFSQKTALARHIEQVHDRIFRFQCEICGSHFTRQEYLRNHRKNIHENARPFQCDVCGSSFHTKGNLDKHILSGHKDKTKISHKCDDCDMVFYFLGTLRRHEKSVHNKFPETVKPIVENGNQTKWPCNLCGKTFSTVFYLRYHKQIVHEKLKQFACTYCSKTFGSKPSLDSHVNGVHLKLRLYECHICHKKFRFHSNVSRHLKTQHDTVSYELAKNPTEEEGSTVEITDHDITVQHEIITETLILEQI